jgi:predicted MFS family arabinose efflux permease
MTTIRGARLVALVCTAQVLVQIGAYTWPALLPSMLPLWSLSNSEAGWITGIFYAAYMLSVPVLVTLTDRIEARLVYLFGVGCTVAAHLMFGVLAEGFWSALALRALAGVGWAGTYMTGLKLLADQVDARMMSRAVTGHAASIGIAGALSFSTSGLVASLQGWSAAFLAAAFTAGAAWLLVAFFAPRAPRRAAPTGTALFDFRPVLRNRSAMAYSIAYCFHTFEMSALRGWGVAFLAFVAAGTGSSEGALGPAFVLTALGLIGTGASVIGNEAAIRYGRRRLICLALLGSALLGACAGFVGALSYPLAVGMLLAWGFVIWLDSSSLTAGSAGTAAPERRGATLAVHSTLGYAGGFLGPLLVGFVLDLHGGMSRDAWGYAFLAVALAMLATLALFTWMRPRELEGDRGR